MLGASPKAKKGATVKVGSMKNPPVAGAGATAPAGGRAPAEEVWEVRPGGLLVQKRGAAPEDEPVNVKPVPTIRVKVKHAGVTHEIYINSQASFDGGGADGASPRRPEGDVQGQGEGLQGVPGHGRRQGPVQARRRRGPRGPRAAPHRGAPQLPPREGRQGRRRRRRRGRQARPQGGGAGRVGAEGGEGGGERRGADDGAAHERAAEARRGGRRRRRQGPEADAGEARAEVRGDARRGASQERRHHAQIQREARQAGAAAEAAAAISSSPSVSTAAGADAVGDVRPAVLAAVDVVGLLDDHRQLHGVVRRDADSKPARLDAVLRRR